MTSITRGRVHKTSIIALLFAAAVAQNVPSFLSLGIQPCDHVDVSGKCTPATFQPLLPSGSSVLFTTSIPTNGTFVENSANAGSPVEVTTLPALCAAKFTIPTSNCSTIDVALFLPDKWNQRLMAVGNGGFGGYINWPDLGQYSHYGFAGLSTNTGHYSGAVDASWALNNPEAIIDWGHRAIHESTLISKGIIEAYYGARSRYNYFSSCSNGGRQGLKELTKYPDDYDGIINGAPAWWLTHLFTWMAELQAVNKRDTSGYISDAQFQKVVSEIVSQCDAQDGIEDGIISDPRGCHFVADTLLCAESHAQNVSECFTGMQMSTLRKVLDDWTDTNQTFVHPKLDLGAQYLLANPVGALYGVLFLQNFVYNSTSYSIEDFDYLNTMKYADSIASDVLNANLEVDEFRARGGKLLQYHGLADELIPSGDSILWHTKVKERLGPQGLSIDDWYRLFLVPGMGHCGSSSSKAPWFFAAALHQQAAVGVVYSTPGFMDPGHDITLAMMNWVEKGIAPTEIIATRYKNDTVALGVERQRPVCVYPNRAIYDGEGEVNHVESWSCSQ